MNEISFLKPNTLLIS